MSVAEMDRLVADCTANNDLQALFNGTQDLDEAVKVARGAGYGIELEEARTYVSQMQSKSAGELSDTQLDAVSGGKKKVGAFPKPL